ncbi:MAG: hypothetical protein ACRD2G_03080 [Terriglobia bacterium]
MCFVFQPWHLFTLTAVGAAEQEYQRTIAYLMAENRVLKAKLGKKRIPLTDDERRVLAVKGKELGRRALEQITTICTPDTILRWHRELVAEKWNHSEKRQSPGRPKVAREVEELVAPLTNLWVVWGRGVGRRLDFLRHGSGVQWGRTESCPGGVTRQSSAAPLTRPST